MDQQNFIFSYTLKSHPVESFEKFTFNTSEGNVTTGNVYKRNYKYSKRKFTWNFYLK